MPSPKRYTEKVRVWLTPSQLARARMRAATLGCTVSDVFRQALDRELARTSDDERLGA